MGGRAGEDAAANKRKKGVHRIVQLARPGTGKTEWQTHDDILKRQVEFSRQLANCSGFSIYSYSSLFGENPSAVRQAERNNLSSLLK